MAHFTPVTLASRVTLDSGQHDHVDVRHYAFLVSDEEFDARRYLGSLIDPVGYERWSFTPATPFIRGCQAALRETHMPGRAVHGAPASGTG